MRPHLRDRLRRIAERHEELGEMLCAPEVVADKPRFLALSREHAELAPLAEAFSEFDALERRLRETERLLVDPDLRDMASADLPGLGREHAELEQRLERLLLPRDRNDDRNVILEIRAGTGGEEAALFAADLWRMYTRWAERGGFVVEPMSVSEAAAGGLKEVVGMVRGRGAYGRLKFESGVHRVQRVPATESQGRIHTSTATVAIMPEAEDVEVEIRDSDLRIDVMRASGSGGQHVNTTDSAVRITHVPSGMAVHCQQEKSQVKNRQIAMQLLRARLLDLETRRAREERAAARKAQVGTGERSEKVRTYNFPQDRVTDHRIGLTVHDIDGFVDGDIDHVVRALMAHDEAERLSEIQDEGPP